MISKIFNSKEQSVLKWGVIIFGGALIWRALSKREYKIKNPDGTEIIRVGKVEPEPAKGTGTTSFNTEATGTTGFVSEGVNVDTDPWSAHSSGRKELVYEVEGPFTTDPVTKVTEPIVDYAGPSSGSPYNTNN